MNLPVTYPFFSKIHLYLFKTDSESKDASYYGGCVKKLVCQRVCTKRYGYRCAVYKKVCSLVSKCAGSHGYEKH